LVVLCYYEEPVSSYPEIKRASGELQRPLLKDGGHLGDSRARAELPPDNSLSGEEILELSSIRFKAYGVGVGDVVARDGDSLTV
jgi:hypothetical protein